ncbi:hypothetical protein [Streptomyces mirabilis]|uniref:hypothetical protein n=1 Tax=Streptomyces mirabilis TaxID=68239 RepID=UPI003717F3AC
MSIAMAGLSLEDVCVECAALPRSGDAGAPHGVVGGHHRGHRRDLGRAAHAVAGRLVGVSHGVHDEHAQRENDDEQQVPVGPSRSYVSVHAHVGSLRV